jgi:trehalose 6-phosphate synthase/phosphatase
MIVAIDRLDYTKGLPERLRTFRRLLTTSPELKEKIVLLQVAVPSRENIGSYQELTSEVHQLIAEINGTFGTQDWVPIVYIYRGISRSELVALYRFAEVAWVSPLRDGMNLVAKEYVACKPDGDGVLVLSSFAGAAAEMGEALLVNPYDEERTAAAVKRALAMPLDERRDRMLPLHERVLRNDVFAWADRFLNALKEAAETRCQGAKGTPALLPLDQMQSSYRQSSKRLLLLDYDGTLVPFTAHPRDAVPDGELRTLLAQLTDDPANSVVVISGRRTAELDAWLGAIPRLGLAAEHGARWRPAGSADWAGRSPSSDWKVTVRPILEHFVDRIPGSCIEEKDFALSWHYRTAEPEFGEWLATELVALLDGMLAETELRAYRGNKIVEVKPLRANKGEIAQQLLNQYAGACFLLGIGDDRTDEDLFATLPSDAWTVHVGNAASAARFRVPDCRGARNMLKALAARKPSYLFRRHEK